jgi:hypothetical protein
LLAQNEALVREESERLAAEARSILAELPVGSYGFAIGHSPLSECAIYGLTGKLFAPLKECEGFLIVEHKGGRLEVEEVRGAVRGRRGARSRRAIDAARKPEEANAERSGLRR